MNDEGKISMSHSEWLDELDLIGASATRAELWEFWASAPCPQSNEAQTLFTYLTQPEKWSEK